MMMKIKNVYLFMNVVAMHLAEILQKQVIEKIYIQR